MGASQGHVALILHAHLPFVRHPEHEEFLEEDWLYEAITETYLPLLEKIDGLLQDGVPFRLTMSITPTLCSMLRDPLLQERYRRHLGRLIELAEKECERTRWDRALNELARFYHERFQQAQYLFHNVYHGDLVSAFARLQDQGCLEIITCAATHGFLPLMQDQPQAVRAQIMIARDHYRCCFGCDPRGIWLPECAYATGIEQHLQEANIRWFVMDTHGLMLGQPPPRYGIFAPVYTPAGVAAFGRDIESSRQVWSADEGYPGDVDYRDFYRDIGFDLPLEYIGPYLHPDGIRCFSGIKYHRITGQKTHKEIYVRSRALEKAADHANNFMVNRQQRIRHLADLMQRPPLVVCPYDAELFGHWWFEGPEFLDSFIRRTASDQKTYDLTTPTEYLRQMPTQQLSAPSPSSWGDKGYSEVWLEGSNGWIYPHLHTAADRMTELVARYPQPNDLTNRALKQAARELLLAQASDWAFIMKTGTSVEYAVKRTKDHIQRFNRIYDQVSSDRIDEPWLAGIEWQDNIFPEIDYRYYA